MPPNTTKKRKETPVGPKEVPPAKRPANQGKATPKKKKTTTPTRKSLRRQEPITPTQSTTEAPEAPAAPPTTEPTQSTTDEPEPPAAPPTTEPTPPAAPPTTEPTTPAAPPTTEPTTEPTQSTMEEPEPPAAPPTTEPTQSTTEEPEPPAAPPTTEPTQSTTEEPEPPAAPPTTEPTQSTVSTGSRARPSGKAFKIPEGASGVKEADFPKDIRKCYIITPVDGVGFLKAGGFSKNSDPSLREVIHQDYTLTCRVTPGCRVQRCWSAGDGIPLSFKRHIQEHGKQTEDQLMTSIQTLLDYTVRERKPGATGVMELSKLPSDTQKLHVLLKLFVNQYGVDLVEKLPAGTVRNAALDLGINMIEDMV